MMVTCTGCHRSTLRAWFLDGTAARYCAACLRRALREADWRAADELVRRLLGRER